MVETYNDLICLLGQVCIVEAEQSLDLILWFGQVSIVEVDNLLILLVGLRQTIP